MLRPVLALALGAGLALALDGRRRPAGRKRFTRDELVALAREAGWSADDAAIAAAIALAESGGDPGAQLVTAREDSRGLWAINTRAHPQADPAVGAGLQRPHGLSDLAPGRARRA